MNKTTTFILSLIVGIIVGALGFSMINSAVHRGSTITKQAGGVDTYSNGTYGISFKYPDSYVLTEKDSGTPERNRHTITLISKADAAPMNASSSPAGEGPTSITLDFFQNNLDNQSITDWVKGNNASNFKLSDGVATPASVAGVPAITYTWDGLYGGNTIVFAHKNNIVMASMTYLTYQDDIWKDFGTLIQSLKLQ